MASSSSGHRFGPEALNVPSAEENVNRLAGGGESEQLAGAPFVLSGNDDHGVILGLVLRGFGGVRVGRFVNFLPVQHLAVH